MIELMKVEKLDLKSQKMCTRRSKRRLGQKVNDRQPDSYAAIRAGRHRTAIDMLFDKCRRK